MKQRTTIFLILLAVFGIAIYTHLTLFIVHRIGAVSEGRPVVMLRLNKTKFIDSPDATCKRIHEGISLLCRRMTMAAVVKNGTILARWPYSQWLYEISNDGKSYEK